MRVERLQPLLEAHAADALLLTSLPDIRWACGFSGSNGVLIANKQKDVHFITDGRYETQAHAEVSGAVVHVTSGDLLAYAQDELLLSEASDILIQSDQLSLKMFEKLQNLFSNKNWIPQSDLLSKIVAIKAPEEIERIRGAQSITDAVFAHLLDFIEPGMTEKEVAAEIVYQHLLRGASEMSFEPIVAAGPNGALPHARPTSRVLRQGELVVIDMGCFKDGYASDMTRTIAIGEPSQKARDSYAIVLNAQMRAVEMASPQLTTSELDTIARSVIEDAGLGAYFTHSLGHGVGLQIHEWPRISWRSTDALEAGMAITIEPGVYIPHEFGIRIEDLVVLQSDGCEVLTTSTKELIVL